MNRRKWIYLSSSVVLILLAVVFFNRTALTMLGFDWFLQGHVEKQLEQTYKPIVGREPVPVSTIDKEQDPFSVLLLGVDQRGKEIGRSDTMIYTVVRPSDGDILMVSIPRDTYVEIVGRGREDKITHAFAFGGAGMAMDTVAKFFDAPIHYYASINFEGFRNVIDTLGGISLPIEEDMVNDDPDHEKFVIRGGQDTYNGQDTLNYVRYREDAGGDMSRMERHQIFLNLLMDKAKQMNQWSKVPDLMNIMGDNFSTDMLPQQLVDLGQGILQAKERNIYSHSLLGNGHRLKDGGAWYYFADEEDLTKVQTMIKSWLNADTPEASLVFPDKYAVNKVKEVGVLSSSDTPIKQP
ncbi:transcriptional regulator [Paenibacillus sp. FSL H8-0548]|uniref:LCP family protein n=1 Tax=Paenibacillus sp. FSL H8-0548 TaxID=1920422 RepID=UPI00096D8114|nr:LCP family protein [Paenibacillus sp. FSL H8-0548]OMF25814.1 transcriptional regulator [Paenibacillus sp. FSL H8-0548]